MFDKRVYHISLDSNSQYKIKSKGLLKSIRIVKNGLDPMPSDIQLLINNRVITVKYNENSEHNFLDFDFIISKIKQKASGSNDEEDDELDYHVMDMMIMTANTKAIPHYRHLSLNQLNKSFFTHEIDLAIKCNDFILQSELKIEEEYYIPTFKLEEKKEEKEEN